MSRHDLNIDESGKLVEIFGDIFDDANERLNDAVRHGVSNAANVLRDEVKTNLSSLPIRSATSTHYSVGLAEGIRTFMLRDDPTAFVTIKGTKRKNDGTWRLRFYNSGTKPRYQTAIRGKDLNKPRYIGFITATHFFDNVASHAESVALENIRNAVQRTIDEINNS